MWPKPKYYHMDDAPMRWWGALPFLLVIGFFLNMSTVLKVWQVNPWIGIVTLVYSIVFFLSGFSISHMKWKGVIILLVCVGVNICGTLLLGITLGFDTKSVVDIVVMSVCLVANYVYFAKRRPLFMPFSGIEAANKPQAENVVEGPLAQDQVEQEQEENTDAQANIPASAEAQEDSCHMDAGEVNTSKDNITTERGKSTSIICLLALFFVVSAVLNVCLYAKNSELHEKNEYLVTKAENSKQEQAQLEDSEETRLNNQVKMLEERVSALKSINANLESVIDGVVFIGESNDYYHHYWCRDMEWSNYYVFNEEYAIYQGFDPCPLCFK